MICSRVKTQPRLLGEEPEGAGTRRGCELHGASVDCDFVCVEIDGQSCGL